EFIDSVLGLQWQWNHNPVNNKWSLTERPGYLTLEALYSDNISQAKNTLTQKLMGNSGVITIEMNIENMAPGQMAGLAFLAGKEENWIGVVKKGDYYFIKTITGGTRTHGPRIGARTVWFRTVVDLYGSTEFYFSTDNDSFVQLGGECKLQSGFWKGARIGLFSFNTIKEGGRADFSCFKYEIE
ncbi:MAG TPA: beta-xylosidase, partial [Thermoclostridium sp.]|nr:beta-xylosidase [Thermoclostridium sp.]